jgi:aspartyl-tRNA(Asn)/glutamyl-tRNA(Gln) amidotransferase subunit C
MSLNDQDISRIANLARLELQPEEQARMLSKINDFFGIVEQIRAVDTTAVVPWPIPLMQCKVRKSNCACAPIWPASLTNAT